jgi:hypothetical protein
MMTSRAMVGLLLAMALQYSAAASMAEGFGCHHSQSHHERGAMAGMSQQHDHAAMQHMVHANRAGDVQKCDCPLKCDCASHCAGGNVGAAVAIRDVGLASNARVELQPGHYPDLVSDPQTSPPFRPPIATAPSAA